MLSLDQIKYLFVTETAVQQRDAPVHEAHRSSKDIPVVSWCLRWQNLAGDPYHESFDNFSSLITSVVSEKEENSPATTELHYLPLYLAFPKEKGT